MASFHLQLTDADKVMF